MLKSIIKNSSIVSVYESSPDGILIVDNNFVVAFHNHQFGEIWKLPSESMYGFESNSAAGHDYMPIFELLTERVKDAVDYMDKVKWLYDHPEVDDKSEVELLDGRTLERYTSGVYHEQQALGRIWFFRDITARKKAEKDLRTHQEKLENLVEIRTKELYRAKQIAEDASRVKSQFLSAMSSALRTPLNAVIGFSQLLKNDVDSPLNEDQQESVDYILSNGEQQLFLINQLLDLSYVGSSDAPLESESVSLNELVEEAIFLLSSMDEDMYDRAQVVSKEMVSVLANRAKLKQVLVNIIRIGLLSTDVGEKLKIDWYITDVSMVKITVSDMNSTALSDNQTKLTELFDGHGYETFDSQGNEIGLLVSKDLIGCMSGQMGFNCDDETGTTFWLELPLAEP